MRRVKVVWNKLIDVASAISLNDEVEDYGIYQIYGNHIVFGAGSLLYIGMTSKQTFGQRIRQHDAEWLKEENEVYVRVGRISEEDYEQDPDKKWADWTSLVKDIEALLIYWHSPPYNARHISDYTGQTLHIQNWGDRGSLLPECTSEWNPPRPKDDRVEN